MTVGLVGQDQISTFTLPVNGASPVDANTVRGQDNTIKTAFNTHDSDGTIHFQSSLNAARPTAVAAGLGAKWIDNDTYRVYYSDGAAWHEIAYLTTAGGTVSGNVIITGTLEVDGNFSVNTNKFTVAAASGNTVVAGTLGVTGASTLTGAVSFGTSIQITANAAAPGAASIVKNATDGLALVTATGSSYDFALYNPAIAQYIVRVPTGTLNVVVPLGTLTGTRLIGGTDVASAIARGVFSDGTTATVPGIAQAQVLSLLTTITSNDSSGTTRVGNQFLTIQSVATAASIPSLQGIGQSTHTSGSLNGMYGGHFIAEAAGVGGTTSTLLGLKAQAGIRGAATVTDAISFEVSQYSVSGGVSTNAYGIKVSTGITNGTSQNWAIYCTSSATSGGVTFRDTALATTATVGDLFIPSCAGAPTGVPANIPTGQIALRYDSTNNFLYVYNGGWKKSSVYA